MKLLKKPLATAVAVASISQVHAVSAADLTLEEVIVTATRRAQSVTEIPYNITALSADDLDRAGVTDLSGVMNKVPGIVFSDQGPRANAINNGIVLRGLNVQAQGASGIFANLAVPTVSTYMDETPIFTNLQLTDIERVEVLRGPQGTLYGSGSLAGTVRFIHNKPNFDGISGNVGGGIEFLGESGDETYTANGALNYPLGDQFALRVAGSYEDRGGVIDYTRVSQFSNGEMVLADPSDPLNSPAASRKVDDADTADAYTIRTSLLWEPSDRFRALAVYHYQDVDADGENYRDLGNSDYEFSRAYINQFEQEVNLGSLELEADLGFATLTSSTSYSENDVDTVRDLGYLIPYLDGIPQYYLLGVGSADREGCAIYGCFPRDVYTADEPQSRDDFTQEFRLVSNGDGDIDWLLGAYYNDADAELESTEFVATYDDWAYLDGSADAAVSAYYGADINLPPGYNLANSWLPLLGALAPQEGIPQLFIDRKSSFEDLAVYGELTYHITDQWQITGGARWFDQEFENQLLYVFTQCGVACTTADAETLAALSERFGQPVTPEWGVSSNKSKETGDDQIFKINTSYNFDNHNVYFTWAEGFRHGGANALPVGYSTITPDDVPYDADETTNWELGLKGYLLDGQLQYSLAAFYIEWDDPQLDAFISIAALPAVINASEAESQGIELAINGNITENLSFAFGYNYTDAEITEDFSYDGDRVMVPEGSDLPGVAEHMANLALDYVVPSLLWDFDLRLHFDGRYKDEAENDLEGGLNQGELDSFTILNASVGLAGEKWDVVAFANNFTDEDEAVTSLVTQAGTNYEAAERPRSFGLRVRHNF
jgi:outer membrane receptor protein involved in Fe transport